MHSLIVDEELSPGSATPGVLACTAAAAAGIERAIVPVANATEATLAQGMQVVAAPTLKTRRVATTCCWDRRPGSQRAA